MDAREAFYQFVLGLVNLVFLAWPIVGPFVFLLIVVRVIRWAYTTARGERDYEEMRQDYDEGVDRLSASYLAAKRELSRPNNGKPSIGYQRARSHYYHRIRHGRKHP